MKTSKLIDYIAPGKEWGLIGEPQNEQEFIDSLTWVSEGTPPSWAELKAIEPHAEYLAQRKSVEDNRRNTYQRDADPLFFGWQRGDNTEQEWLDAVQAVKDANPYPEEPLA